MTIVNDAVLAHARDKAQRPRGLELLYCEQFLSREVAEEVALVLQERSDVYGASVYNSPAPGRFDVVAWGKPEPLPRDGKSNAEFLSWLHDRLVYVHKENVSVDYMHRLRELMAAHFTLEKMRVDHKRKLTDAFNGVVGYRDGLEFLDHDARD